MTQKRTYSITIYDSGPDQPKSISVQVEPGGVEWKPRAFDLFMTLPNGETISMHHIDARRLGQCGKSGEVHRRPHPKHAECVQWERCE